MRYSNTPKRIVRLTESDLTRIIRRVIREQEETKLLADELRNVPGVKLSKNELDLLKDNGVIFVEKMKAPKELMDKLKATQIVKFKETPESDVKVLIASEVQKPMSVSKMGDKIMVMGYGQGPNPFGKGVYAGPKPNTMELKQFENMLSNLKELMDILS
jgi:hypothetical protein